VDEDDKNWREFDLLRAGFQSVCKAQTFYVNTLLVYLFVVWGWESISATGGVTIQVLGLSLYATGFWPITPLVVSVVTLGLVGAMNAMGPLWKRLASASTTVGLEAYFTDLDVHKNILDYFTFLRLHPERIAQPGIPIPKREQFRRFKLGPLLYPFLIAWGIYTTYYALDRLPKTTAYMAYALSCLGLQLMFSLRVFWRAICGFLGIRRDKTTF